MPAAIVTADLFEIPATILVNPCNTIGIPGGGMSLEFAQRFPKSIAEYKRRCAQGKLKIGEPWMTPILEHGKQVLHFPTKEHWRNPSQLKWIDDGLAYILKNRFYFPHSATDIYAFPALGAGLGKLDMKQVLEVMQHHLNAFEAQSWICLYKPWPTLPRNFVPAAEDKS